MSTLVKDFMHQPVASIALPNDVGTVRDLMNQKGYHAIPLVEVGSSKEITIRGIVTSDDLVGVYDDTVDIRQVMTTELHTIDLKTTARNAAKIMLQDQVHHLLVMDQGRLVGIISSIDFVKLVAEIDI